ncbi:MAG: hypothetical protein CMN30_28450 [Sandaracinus sp.]|nr:hypothetical protein [Sandaracinus sp.]
MSRTRPALAASLLLAGLLGGVAPVAAQSGQVFVLGIRSVEGDDELARNLTGAIRQEARGITDWSVAEADISLAQMSVAHGCDEPDAQCMADIAAELEASRIIYGTVRRTGAGDEYDYALTLYNFNASAGQGQIEDSLTDTIPRVQSDIDQLRPRAERYVAQFAGQARFGSVRISTNTPGAAVFIDGENVGTTDEAGALVVTDVTEGDKTVRISAADYDEFESSLTVVPDEQTELRANLGRTQGPNLGWIPGAAVIAGGVVLAAVGMVFGIKNQKQIDERGDIVDAPNRQCIQDELGAVSGTITAADRAAAASNCRTPVGFEITPLMAGLLTSNSSDICDEDTSRVEGLGDACDDRQRNLVMQYVMYGLGAVAVGTGIFLLIRGLSADEDEEQASGPRVDISPWMAGVRDMGVNATVEW